MQKIRKKYFLFFLFFLSFFLLENVNANFTPPTEEFVFNFSGKSGDFDENWATTPTVLIDGGVYMLYYSGLGNSNHIQIGLAVSNNKGSSFSKYQNLPIFTCGENSQSGCGATNGSIWSDFRVMPISVLKDGNNDYKMWYRGENKNLYSKKWLGLATSEDGINWTPFQGNPVFGSGDQNFIDIIKKNEKEYLLYYTDNEKKVRVARSENGISWQEYSEGSISDTEFSGVEKIGDIFIAVKGDMIGVSRNGLDFIFEEVSSLPESAREKEKAKGLMLKKDFSLIDNTIHLWYAQFVGNKNWSYGNYSINYTHAPLSILDPLLLKLENQNGDVPEKENEEKENEIASTGTLLFEKKEEESKKTSLAFFPGITGSRLYASLRRNTEEKLWESFFPSSLRSLALNKDGEGVKKNVYAKDIVPSIDSVTGLWSYKEVYRPWMNFLDSLVKEDVLGAWEAFPYDWRFGVDTLAKSGIEQKNKDGAVSFISQEETFYFINKIRSLQESSQNGKVIIVSHSNGGLLVQHILRVMEKEDPSLLSKIETVVFVGVPHFGTPKTIGELLHGTTPPFEKITKESMLYMPSVYGLLPLHNFFQKKENDPVIVFDSSLKYLNGWEKYVGTKIIDSTELKNFMTKKEGRPIYSSFNEKAPSTIDALLFSQAEEMHSLLGKRYSHINFINIVGTGLSTPSGVKYSHCTMGRCEKGNKNSLLRSWIWSRDGDGTVLASSAIGFFEKDTHIFDIEKYNKKENTNYAHGSLLSLPPLQNIILSLIQNSFSKDDLENREKTKTIKKEKISSLHIRAYSPISIHLLDEEKRHTGPTGETGVSGQFFYEEEIPNSLYTESGGVSYIILSSFSSEEVYKIDIEGLEEGTFSLHIEFEKEKGDPLIYYFNDISVQKNSYGSIEIKGDSEPTLFYDFTGEGKESLPLSPLKEVSFLEEEIKEQSIFSEEEKEDDDIIILSHKLSYGMRNDSVSKLQEMLAKEGYYKLITTGYFGNHTFEALKRYKKAKGVL